MGQFGKKIKCYGFYENSVTQSSQFLPNYVSGHQSNGSNLRFMLCFLDLFHENYVLCLAM
ncbi:unnamed protein product [Arabidopsis halleri]